MDSIRPSPNTGVGILEDHVVVGDLRGEVRLRQGAAVRAEPAGDREQRMHAAVGRTIGVGDEARASRTGPSAGQKRRQVIEPTRSGWRRRSADSRRGSNSPDRRLRMAAAAAYRGSWSGPVPPRRSPPPRSRPLPALRALLELMVGQPRQRGAPAHAAALGPRARIGGVDG